MVSLCSNRPEGFGPSSTLSSPIPTTCFVDVILIPLPVWVYLALLPGLLALTLHRRRSDFNPSTAHLRSQPKRSLARTTVTVIYYLLIIANILMQVLEIVRLALINYGVGLLPFVFVALLFVLASHLLTSFRPMMEPKLLVAANTFVWVGLMAMEIVKSVGLGKEQSRGERRIGSKYPVSDQIIDVAVMAGVFAVLALLEVALAVWREKAGHETKAGAEVDSMEVERLGKQSSSTR